MLHFRNALFGRENFYFPFEFEYPAIKSSTGVHFNFGCEVCIIIPINSSIFSIMIYKDVYTRQTLYSGMIFLEEHQPTAAETYLYYLIYEQARHATPGVLYQNELGKYLWKQAQKKPAEESHEH